MTKTADTQQRLEDLQEFVLDWHGAEAVKGHRLIGKTPDGNGVALAWEDPPGGRVLTTERLAGILQETKQARLQAPVMIWAAGSEVPRNEGQFMLHRLKDRRDDGRRVHVVWFTDYSFAELLGVYTDPENAREVAERLGAQAVEMELDPATSEWEMVEVLMARDGSSRSVAKLDRYAGIASGFLEFDPQNRMVYQVPGQDAQQATKGANDCRARLLTNNLWPESIPADDRERVDVQVNAKRFLMKDESR